MRYEKDSTILTNSGIKTKRLLLLKSGWQVKKTVWQQQYQHLWLIQWLFCFFVLPSLLLLVLALKKLEAITLQLTVQFCNLSMDHMYPIVMTICMDHRSTTLRYVTGDKASEGQDKLCYVQMVFKCTKPKALWWKHGYIEISHMVRQQFHWTPAGCDY